MYYISLLFQNVTYHELPYNDCSRLFGLRRANCTKDTYRVNWTFHMTLDAYGENFS